MPGYKAGCPSGNPATGDVFCGVAGVSGRDATLGITGDGGVAAGCGAVTGGVGVGGAGLGGAPGGSFLLPLVLAIVKEVLVVFQL